jgi:hypothetical protein
MHTIEDTNASSAEERKKGFLMTDTFNPKDHRQVCSSVMLLIVVVSFSFLLLNCNKAPVSLQQGAAEKAAQAAAYKNQIEISHIGIARGENYLGDAVYYVQGKIKNSGNKAIQRVELTFQFRDSLGQVVLKDTRRALDYKGGGKLEAQASSEFQVGFEKLPKDWNYVIPQVEVASVILQ